MIETSHGLDNIYDQVERRTALKQRSQEPKDRLDDSFVVTPEDRDLIHDLAMEGASVLASHAKMIRNSAQTGIEALTYQCCYDSDPAMGVETDANMKLISDTDKPVRIAFKIAGLEKKTTEEKSVVQQFIHSALIHYILYKWYQIKGYSQWASEDFTEHMRFADLVKTNAVITKTHRRKPTYL
jgi:hypothetical protein